MATINQTSDFVILGPTLARDGNVFEAIHALYFLPERYKMVFTGSPADKTFYDELQSLVKRNELSHRVQFESKASDPRVAILPSAESSAEDIVSGDSAEALASAILHVARIRS